MHQRRRPVYALLALLTALALIAASCGDDDGATSSSDTTAPAKTCTGDPVKIGLITQLTDVPGGAKYPGMLSTMEAAAKAETDECTLGRPIEIVSCDDKFDPNLAGECARKMVAEKVMYASTLSQGSDNIIPILAAAGIPDIGGISTGAKQNTDPNSYAFIPSAAAVKGMLTLAVSLGAKRPGIVVVDVPAVLPLVTLGEAHVKALGVDIAPTVRVPVTAADVAPQAAQAIGQKPDALITVTGQDLTQKLWTAWRQQGVDWDEIKIINSSTGSGPEFLKATAPLSDGLYVTHFAWPYNDESNAGIKQLHEELQAIDEEDANVGDPAITAWSALHEMVELMKGATTFDGKTLQERIKTMGPIERPEIGEIDLTKPAFPEDPLFKNFRIFLRQQMVVRVDAEGNETPVTDGFVDMLKPTEIKE